MDCDGRRCRAYRGCSLRCWGTSFDAAQQNAAQRTRVQGLIADLNAPYGGPIRVSADTWTSVINSMR